MSGGRRGGLRERYDETPYHDQAFEAFDLARLIGLAELFGLRAPGTPPLRVLDLGCASGLHLREQAKRYPDVEFYGVDFSRAEIESGRKAIEEDRIANVRLTCSNLLDYEVAPEAYDVVLCHGVFSWVPDAVKERILALARQALRPDGVAAIAYLTYPGWKQLEAFRDLLQMRARPSDSPDEQLHESALLLRFLRSAFDAMPGDVHARSLSAMVERMQRSSSNAFLHDELGAIHDPCYFLQFVEWAEEWGLQYLAETDLGAMRADAAGSEAAALQRELAPTFLESQQWIDFAVNRSGRSSLMIRSDAHFDRVLSADSLEALQFGTSWWRVTPVNAPADSAEVFESPNGRRFETECVTSRAILDVLVRDRSAIVPFSDLTHEASGDVAETLLQLVALGLVEARARF